MAVVPNRRGWLAALFAGLLLAAQVGGQPKAEPPKASAIKLPDGTIVFLTKSPEDVNPPIDGVLLSAAEFKALTDKSEQAKKAKPVAPSGVAIRGQVELRGDRPVVALTLTYSFRTTQPRTVVALGCQRAAVLAAKSGSGQLPILNPPTDEGLTAFADAAGEHTIILTVEVPVTPRGGKNEVGFDFGLPRSAITTLELTKPPVPGLKMLTLGTRISEGGAKPAEVKATSISLEALGRPLPLGATDTLELMWEKPKAPAAVDPGRSIDADIAVRVDETTVETVAKLRLRGAAKEWPLHLPLNADVVVDRATPSLAGGPAETAVVVRPADAAKPTWTIRLPNDPSNPEWLATVTVRQLRPKPADPKFRGPYAVGPFHSPAATKQTGRVRVSAAATVRLSYKPLADVRRIDLPPGADDDLVSVFQYAALPTPAGSARAPALMELDGRTVALVPRVRPHYKLRLTAGGWQLETVLRITPPMRGEVEQLLVEMPAGWQKRLDATPEEIVGNVQVLKEGAGRSLAVRFSAPQKAAFELTFSSTFPIPPGVHDLSIPLPRFPQADEREAKVTASVADGLELRGTGFAVDASHAGAESLKPPAGGRTGVATTLQGEFDRGLERVELIWQPYRPELPCDVRAEVTVQDRQTVVAQTIVFKPTADDPRPVRIHAPANAVGQQSTPPLDPVDVGSNEWEFRPPSGAKEFTLVVNYAFKHPKRSEGDGPQRLELGLFWPELASHTSTHLRVWGNTAGRRGELVNDGQWQELPPEPAAGRGTLPWFTLASARAKAPLVLDLFEPSDMGVPNIVVERAIMLASASEDGTARCRAKFLLVKWTGAFAEVQLPRVQALEVYLDGKRADGVAAPENEAATLRVPLPDGRAGKSAVIELRYRTTMARGPSGERSLAPPVIRGAAVLNPLRWYLGVEAGLTPLTLCRNWNLELHWAWRKFGFGPAPTGTAADLDGWFSAGVESDHAADDIWPEAVTDAIAARQGVPASATFYLLPRFGCVAVLSVLGFALGYAVTRLPIRSVGSVLGVLAVGAAVTSALAPHAAAQACAAIQPGLAALALFFLAKGALQMYLRRRVDHLPAFSRWTAAPSPSGSQQARPEIGSRPSRVPNEPTISSRPASAAKG